MGPTRNDDGSAFIVVAFVTAGERKCAATAHSWAVGSDAGAVAYYRQKALC